jgi:hypothetical protein
MKRPASPSSDTSASPTSPAHDVSRTLIRSAYSPSAATSDKEREDHVDIKPDLDATDPPSASSLSPSPKKKAKAGAKAKSPAKPRAKASTKDKVKADPDAVNPSISTDSSEADAGAGVDTDTKPDINNQATASPTKKATGGKSPARAKTKAHTEGAGAGNGNSNSNGNGNGHDNNNNKGEGGDPNVNGIWTGENRAGVMEEVIAAGYKALSGSGGLSGVASRVSSQCRLLPPASLLAAISQPGIERIYRRAMAWACGMEWSMRWLQY